MLFTEAELRFLDRHGFSPDDVYNGRFQSKEDRRTGAEREGKIIVIGPSCRAEGHRLRTRSGHCIQCDPKKIAFQAREESPGFVYIAGSISARLIKIGSASDVDQREKQIRGESYGGISDWVVLFCVKVEEMGRIERVVSNKVEGRRVFKTYIKDGREQTGIELFECPVSSALKALTSSISDEYISRAWKSPALSNYEFT